jgi:hypothetical protein
LRRAKALRWAEIQTDIRDRVNSDTPAAWVCVVSGATGAGMSLNNSQTKLNVRVNLKRIIESFK